MDPARDQLSHADLSRRDIVARLGAGGFAALDATDGFPETGMVHSVPNLSDETITTVFSGLVEQGQPLTSCVDEASPMAGSGQ